MSSRSSTSTPRSGSAEAPGSTADPGSARQWPDTVIVGRVRKPHGVRGEVRIEVLSDNADRFVAGVELQLVPSELSRGLTPRTVTIERSRPDKGDLLVHFEGIEDRDAVEGWRGALLEVDRASVPAAEDGTYYYFELVGCRCHDRQAGDLGEIVDVLEDGGGLLLLTRHGDRELPIPFVNRFIEHIDIQAGRIELNLPPGLVELCTSKS